MGETNPASGGGWEPPGIEHLQTLLPQYEISRLLGHGGMGAVYEGVQSNLDRKVAIKILPETLGENVDGLNFTERFKLEAKSMANLDHPGIISVHDFGETREGQLYFVMEFIDGMDIHQYLKHHGGKLPPESAIAIVAHVLDALGYAHERGIIHRDIKPANIMIKSDGRVKVADFGLVKRLSDSGEGTPDSAALTMTNVAIGTPDFVAPESLEIGRVVDHRADLYAIGVMFYQLLTGIVPRGNFKPPSGKISELDPRLDTIVMRAMEADPEDRYASADEFRAAIDEILSSPVPEEQPTGPVTPGGKRLHITSVKKKSPVPAGSTGPVKGQAAPAGAAGESKKKSPALIAAIVVIGVTVIGGAALFFGGGGGSEGDEKGNGKKGPKVAEVNQPKAGGKSKSGKTTTPARANPKPATPPPKPKPEPKVVQKPTTPEPAVPDPTPPTPKPEPTTPEPSPEPTPAPVPTPEDPVAQQLAEIDAQYREFFENPYAEALATLNQQFSGALKREEQTASQTGDLDLVLAFQNEVKQIGNGQGAGPADAADVPPKLKQWRTTWHTQHQKLLDEQAANRKNAHAKRDLALDGYQQERVKARDIAAAQRIKALREQLAANPDTGVAAVAVGVPPGLGPGRSSPGAGSPTLPVITAVPKIEYPPKRPERVGELIRFSLKEMGEPEVVAREVVDFRVPRSTGSNGEVFVLSPNGELKLTEGPGTGLGATAEFKSVSSQLSDVVAFDIGEGRWGIALGTSGKLTAWPHAHPVVSKTPVKLDRLSRVMAPTAQLGFGLTESGAIHCWPNGNLLGWFESIGQVADIQVMKPNNRDLPIALTSRGRISVKGVERFEAEDRETIEKTRNAVAFETVADFGQPYAHPATLILLDSGEIVSVGWPRTIFPGGNPLPPKLPKDIETLYVASLAVVEDDPEAYLGAILTRSQGWVFFGNGFDAEALREKARGCFQIAVVSGNFYGLRDPQSTAKPTPPVSVTPPPSPAAAPGAKLPDLPPARRRIVENGGPLHVWGIYDGQPIDGGLEKQIIRALRGRDYTRVAVGHGNYPGGWGLSILAVRKDGQGANIRIPLRGALNDGREIETSEFRDVQLIDSNGQRAASFVADNRFMGKENNWGKFKLDEQSQFAKGKDMFLLREAGGIIRARCEFQRYDPAKAVKWEAVAEIATRDKARLMAVNGNSRLIWLNDRNEVRARSLPAGAEAFEDFPIETQPGERIVQLAGGGRHGLWIALGESGNVYADKLGGFTKPVADLPSAREIRLIGETAGNDVVLQKMDGSWEFNGSDPELKAFISQMGPAIDLDVYVYKEKEQLKHRVVVWVEPESSLK